MVHYNAQHGALFWTILNWYKLVVISQLSNHIVLLILW